MEEPPILDPFLEEQMRNFEVNDRPPSFRHSRAFRNFKNPPQPHMCIRDLTADGVYEVLINVMSWTRIVKPQTPNDPIPLYGGMRVLACTSSRSPPQLLPNPPMLFAVMANPEVLKKASRNSVDDQDLTALVELMCEFVEAMNPGLKLLRQPVVLKDRDLSGELKNIWGAVQAKRDTEREQFMTEKGANTGNLVVYTELGPDHHTHEPVEGVDLTSGRPEDVTQGTGISQSIEQETTNRENGEENLQETEDQQKDVPAKPDECDVIVDSSGLNSALGVSQDLPDSVSERAVDVVAVPVAAPPVAPVVVMVAAKGGGGKAEKEVANVKEKKDKSISGFLHSGLLFGKRNKDKDANGGATKEKSGKVKLGSFKSKLLLGGGGGGGGNKEKEDKGSDTNGKNTQFSEIGQSVTTAAK